MSIEELVGQRFFVGIPWAQACDKLDDGAARAQLKKLITEMKIGGFFISHALFSEWAEKLGEECVMKVGLTDLDGNSFPETLADFAAHVQELSQSDKGPGIPAFIAADYEGGRSQGLKRGFSVRPAAMAVGATQDWALARELGRVTARELRAAGLTTNFAPVVDLLFDANSFLIGTRAIGMDAEVVALTAEQLARGYLDSGISPVLKHWPGHGERLAPLSNSWNPNIEFHHYPLPLQIGTPKAQFEEVHFEPYDLLLNGSYKLPSGVAVMTSHLEMTEFESCSKTDGSITKHLRGRRILTFCERTIRENLRERQSFEGVVITDDFVSLSALHTMPFADAVLKALDSGHDMVVVSNLHFEPSEPEKRFLADLDELLLPWSLDPVTFSAAYQKVVSHYQNVPGSKAELVRSAGRILEWKRSVQSRRQSWTQWLPTTLRGAWDWEVFEPTRQFDEARDRAEGVANQLFEKSVLLVKGDSRAFKGGLDISADTRILAIAPVRAFDDLRSELERAGYSNVRSAPLRYDDESLQSESLVNSSVDSIRRELENDPQLIIFGLANYPAHKEVWARLRVDLERAHQQEGARIILALFHSPSIIAGEDVPDGTDVVAVFSNLRKSNELLVELVKNGLESGPASDDLLPVEVTGIVEGRVGRVRDLPATHLRIDIEDVPMVVLCVLLGGALATILLRVAGRPTWLVVALYVASVAAALYGFQAGWSPDKVVSWSVGKISSALAPPDLPPHISWGVTAFLLPIVAMLIWAAAREFWKKLTGTSDPPATSRAPTTPPAG